MYNFVISDVHSAVLVNVLADLGRREHTILVPHDGFCSTTTPRPASSRGLMALTALSLFPLSRKCLAARSALMWSCLPGRRRQ